MNRGAKTLFRSTSFRRSLMPRSVRSVGTEGVRITLPASLLAVGAVLYTLTKLSRHSLHLCVKTWKTPLILHPSLLSHLDDPTLRTPSPLSLAPRDYRSSALSRTLACQRPVRRRLGAYAMMAHYSLWKSSYVNALPGLVRSILSLLLRAVPRGRLFRRRF